MIGLATALNSDNHISNSPQVGAFSRPMSDTWSADTFPIPLNDISSSFSNTVETSATEHSSEVSGHRNDLIASFCGIAGCPSDTAAYLLEVNKN